MCAASVVSCDTTGNKSDCSKEELVSSHDDHEGTSIEVLEADQSVKAMWKRVENENIAISKAYNEEKKLYLDKVKSQQDESELQELIVHFSDLYTIKSSLYHHKWKNFPKLP
jgi:hypothetical protein